MLRLVAPICWSVWYPGWRKLSASWQKPEIVMGYGPAVLALSELAGLPISSDLSRSAVVVAWEDRSSLARICSSARAPFVLIGRSQDGTVVAGAVGGPATP